MAMKIDLPLLLVRMDGSARLSDKLGFRRSLSSFPEEKDLYFLAKL